MSPSEYLFYKQLITATENRYSIIPQVHLDELVKPTEKGNQRIFSFRHINQKSVDFVICDKQTLSPKLAIELDDRSHKMPDRIERDVEVERILKETGLPLVRLEKHLKYSLADLQKQISSQL